MSDREDTSDKEDKLQTLIQQLNTTNSIYKEISIGTLVFHSRNHFQSKIPYCLEEFFYRSFCGQINQESFVKAMVRLYGQTCIRMFNVELYNCIGSNFEYSTRSKVICDQLQNMNDKLNVSFQNIKLLKNTGENIYETELNYGGIGLPLGKNLVRYNFKHKLFKKYQSQLEIFFQKKIEPMFEIYDEGVVYNLYESIFNFENIENIYLHQQDIDNIVNVFLSTSIKKKSKGVFLSGGDGDGGGDQDEVQKKGENRFTEGVKDLGNAFTKNMGKIKSVLPGAIPIPGIIPKSFKYNPKPNEKNGTDGTTESGKLKNILDIGIYLELDLTPIITENLNCKQIKKYIVNGFEKLLKENVSKHVDEIEIIISEAFSNLMLHIYDTEVSTSKQNVKYNIIHSFVNNYPFDKLFILLKENDIFTNLKDKIQISPIITNKIFKFWESNFGKFIEFMTKKHPPSINTNKNINVNVNVNVNPPLKVEQIKEKVEEPSIFAKKKQSSFSTAKDYLKKNVNNITKKAKKGIDDDIKKNIKENVNIENIIKLKEEVLTKIKTVNKTIKDEKVKIEINKLSKALSKINKDSKIDPNQIQNIEQFLQKLLQAKPIQIINGFANFFGPKSNYNSIKKMFAMKGGIGVEERITFFIKMVKLVKPKTEEIKGGDNIKTKNMLNKTNRKKVGKGGNKNKTRKPCPKGSRWVEKAQKCMTTEEKNAFMIEYKNNRQNLAHQSVKETLGDIKSSFRPFDREADVDAEPKEEVEADAEPKEEKESSKERAFDLKPEQKKCPVGYTQHPKKSRKCVKNEDIRKSSFTRKQKSKIPEIQSQADVLPVEDISPSQHPMDEKIDEPVKEEKVKNKTDVIIDSEKQEYDDYLQNPDSDSFLYPHLLDPDFNTKIALKKEFSDFRYDGEIQDIVKQSRIECNAPFELLPNQQFVKNFLSIQTPYNSLLLYAGLGTGKCHAKGTPIMMHDGNIKLVEEIKVGDLLMGDDSKPRCVLSLANGRDKMYDIIPVKGDKYTVNEEHILCLRASGNTRDITEITVKDYLQLPESQTSVLKGYKVAVDFPERKTDFHPYIVGNSYLNYYGFDYIPPEYKYNTRENRLNLLAGIIDGIGGYDIVKHAYLVGHELEQVAIDVLFVTRSLGFDSSIKKIGVTKTVSYIETHRDKFIVSIMGDLNIIPTKIITCSTKVEWTDDVLVTGINVKYMKEDEYYGFTLDGNGRYLMGDFTVTHNTCAAIGVTEEMRMYMKQVGIVKKILIVASPNVQSNFRLQLFDDSKLHEIGKKGSGVWNLDTCVGYDLLREIQTTNMTREYVVRKINTIINEYYDFIGYESLANYIEEMSGLKRSSNNDMEDTGDIDEKRIRRVFDDRLIVIDEVHNIIGKEDNDNKHTSNMMMKLVKVCENLRMLFLSATPMYNSYKEIIWLLNIMNMNDHRSTVKVEQVFQENGDFVEEVKEENGVILQESGKDLLKRKLIGYVSYVRGENPYTFPYRIYPSLFAADENQLQKQTYPKLQMNRTEITTHLQHLEVYVTKMGEYQKNGYDLLIQFAKDYQPNFEEKESFGYTVLQGPISALNMIYPNEDLDTYIAKVNPNPPKETSSGFMGITSIFGGEGEESKEEESKEEESKEEPERKIEYTKEQLKEIIRNLHGSKGLQNVISFSKPDTNIPLFHNFEYKPEILEKYGRIFNTENISKYSSKIANICDIISKSTGIVLIYSKFIEGGLIPMALALEELGFQRYGEANYTKSLFKEKPVDFVLNPLTMKPNGPTETFSAKYVMITGQKYYSPNNESDLKLVTDTSNKNGEQVRVVLISEAGSEGLDFKNIRQVHILDPWYNMNRIEQVIGRAVRNKSHCSLPISERNVEIYLHGTYIDDEIEAADIYLYRLAEKKALQIGKVTRVLKESAVDCLLNIDQKNFTQEKMGQNLNLTLSTNQKVIEYPVGDKPFSNMCDYMESCDFTCSGKPPTQTKPEITPTYDNYFLQNNHPRISKRIRQVFREKVFYTLDDLVKEINIIKPFPLEQVYYSITIFLKSRDEWLVDKKGRKGYLIQKKDVYAFQPLEIANEKASIFERSNPLEYKRKSIPIEMPKDPILTIEPTIVPTTTTTTTSVIDEYQTLYHQLKKDVDMVLNTSSYVKPLKQNMNWYRYAKLSIKVCIEKHKIDRKDAIRYVVYHHMDCLPLKERLVILHKLLSTFESFSIPTDNDESIETLLKKYFIEKIDQSDPQKKNILMNSKNNNVVYSLVKDSRLWKEEPGFPENNTWIQTFQIRKTLIDKVNAESNKDECNVGFIGIFKENYAFKIKNLLNTRPKPGALCDQADKQKLIGKINALLENTGRTSEVYNADPVHGQSAIERPNLCIIYECLMRFITEKENKCWFLSPEQAIASDLDHFIVVPQTLFGITNYVAKS